MSQSILEILKTITIAIVFKISKMDCDSARAALPRAAAAAAHRERRGGAHKRGTIAEAFVAAGPPKGGGAETDSSALVQRSHEPLQLLLIRTAG